MKYVSTNKFNFPLNFIYTFLLILLLPLYPTVYGQNIPWAKHPDNPVLDVGPPGSWNDTQVGTPSVIFENDTFKMWYGGHDGNIVRIGYATSLDGAIWNKDTIHSPVLPVGAPGEWDDEKVYCPSVVFVNGIYHMWYSGAPDLAADTILIGHATSSDGLVWTKDPDNPVLEQGPAGSWDSYPWFFSFVIFENDTFHLWYSSFGNNQGQIGYATATDPYGKNWTKYSENPVLSPTYGTWDWSQVIEPSVATYNGTLYMFYRGGYEQGDIGFATSTDKVTWYKNPDPCLVRGPAGSWDSYSLSFPNVIYDGNEYKLWYCGRSSSTGGLTIGLATTLTLSPDTLNVPGQYSTIQAAIDAATDGDVVLVAEGTYYENINYKGKAITVASYFLLDGDTSHISNTIIDGSQPSHPDSGSVVSFISGEDTTSVLCGFTITGGTGTYNPVWTEFEGGGVFCSHAGAKIIYNRIIDNEVVYSVWAAGGGIFMDFEEEQYWTVIENNIISNNYAEAGSPAAAGIFVGNNSIIRNNIIENNTCFNSSNQNYLYGGGIGVDGSTYWTHTVYCQNNIIRNNIIRGGYYSGGAGIWLDDGDFYVEDNEISYNLVEQAGNFVEGVGLLITNPDAECLIKGNEFKFNTTAEATSNGGAICITDAGGTSITIDGNLIEGNESSHGGGLMMYGPLDASIINNLFVANNADFFGGAINFANMTESSSSSIGKFGRGVKKNTKDLPQTMQYALPVIINNTFAGNTAQSGGALFNIANTDMVILNSIFWENEALVGMDIYQYSNTEVNVSYSDIESDSIFGNWTGVGNIYENPLFVNASTGDFHLQDASLCIGAGIDSLNISGTFYHCPQFCYYGGIRPNPANTIPDIGACESPRETPNSVNNQILIPSEYSLTQNYPNPFNPSTTIKYGIPERKLVELKVYDILGREVITLVNEELDAGYYQVNFNAAHLSSGVYLYQLKTGGFIETKKMLLIR